MTAYVIAALLLVIDPKFIELPGVAIYQQTDFKVVLSLWPSLISDFGDSLIAATAKSVKGATVITFDEKYKISLNKIGIESV